MTKEEILNKAKYIQFPVVNTTYKEYNIENIHKLPCIRKYNPLYSFSKSDKHHYTLRYHRDYVLPLINDLLNFGYNENDFNLIKCFHNKSDISYLVPKQKMYFDVYWLLGTKKYLNIPFENGLIFNKQENHGEKLYRNTIIGCHTCLKIINNSINSNKKILISGDSQVIPDIAILACYYKEVWYMDNRSGKINNETMDLNKTISIEHLYKNEYFDDIIIELYTNPLWWYIDVNLK